MRTPADVVFIYPGYAGMVRWLINVLSRKKQVRLVCYIGDIDGIKDGNAVQLLKDINALNRFTHFIVHNAAMQRWLMQYVPGSVSGVINFFDFLAQPVRRDVDPGPYHSICFAGNLTKSGFLRHLHTLPQAIQFHIYGPGGEAISPQPNVVSYGVFTPYELPAKVEGQFGLVWDGESITGPGGSLGEYMKYISHHKLSLYILAGLPLIVPSFAASAALVEKLGIGIAIDSLEQLAARIQAVDAVTYQHMQKNMQPVAERISSGGCIIEALRALPDQGI